MGQFSADDFLDPIDEQKKYSLNDPEGIGPDEETTDDYGRYLAQGRHDDDPLKSIQSIGQNIAMNGPSPDQVPFDMMPAPMNRGPQDADRGPASMPPPQAAPPEQENPGAPLPESPGGPVNDESVTSDSPNALSDLMITKDDLDKANRQKKVALALGMMGDAMANGQSAGNFYTGRMAPHHDVQGFASKIASLSNAPIEQKKILLGQMLKQPEMEMAVRSANPTSTESRLMGSMMTANVQNNAELTPAQKASMLKDISGKSALELNQIAKSGPWTQIMANDKLYQSLRAKAEAAELAFRKWGLGQDRTDKRANAHNNSLQGRTDIQAYNAVQHQVAPMAQQSLNIDKAIDQFSDPNHPPSWTQVSEVAQDISAALSNSKVSSDFKLNKIEKHTLDQNMGDLKGFLTSNPDQPASPEVVKFWKNMATRLKAVYGKQMKARAETIERSAPDSVKGVMSKAAAPYADGTWNGPVETPPPAGGTVQMRDPKGNIRAVPKDQVDAAKAAGGVVVGG